MSASDREGLITRIRQIRRVAPVRDHPQGDGEASQSEQIRALEARVGHLERLLEGLQDSVYRESERHAKLIATLQDQLQPEALSAALADDARSRGI